jgi:hypothetical protein
LDEVHPVQEGPDGSYRFRDMYDRVDVDGKWFCLTRKKSEAYILIAANDEDDEGESHVYRAVKNTKHLHYSLPTMVTAQMMRAKSYNMSPLHTKSMIKPRSTISGFL